MIAEIITIGSEILLGQVPDTNFMYLTRELTAIGVEVRFRTTVGDDLEQIEEVLRRAMVRAEVVVTAGGLGPTHNDLTRQAVAAVTGKALIFREELMEQIQAFYHRIRRTPTEYDRRQACIPEGAIPISNPIGTAPGFILKQEGRAILCLCGAQAEFQHMTDNVLIPFLLQRSGRNSMVFSRTLKLTGLSETIVEKEFFNLMRDVINPSVGVFSFPGETHICLTARGETSREAMSYLQDVEDVLREKFGEFIFGKDEETLESVVAAELGRRTMSVALLETSTAGRVARRLIESNPAVVKEGRIVGDAGHGDERPDRVSLRLADRIRRETGASIGVATVGAVEPGIPSLTTWVGMSTEGREVATTLLMARSPEVNRRWAVQFTLDQVRRFIADGTGSLPATSNRTSGSKRPRRLSPTRKKR